MSISVREATAADRDAILALRERCFGEVDTEKRDPRFWEWEFSRARCFVGEEDGRVVTHFALIETPYTIDGQVVRGAMAVDAMTAPEARGRGAFSQIVAHAMQAASFELATAYQIRDAVLGAMLRGGWSIAEKVPVLVRPMLLGSRAESARTLTRDDIPRMASIAASSSAGASVARTEEWLAWRFFDNPHWHYRVTGNDGAYLVARRTVLKGYDTFAIADLAFTDRRAAWQLLGDAIREAKRQRCTLAAALVSRHHPARPLFLLRGFLPGPHRFRLLVWCGAGNPAGPVRQDCRTYTWRIMWADTDHL